MSRGLANLISGEIHATWCVCTHGLVAAGVDGGGLLSPRRHSPSRSNEIRRKGDLQGFGGRGASTFTHLPCTPVRKSDFVGVNFIWTWAAAWAGAAGVAVTQVTGH